LGARFIAGVSLMIQEQARFSGIRQPPKAIPVRAPRVTPEQDPMAMPSLPERFYEQLIRAIASDEPSRKPYWDQFDEALDQVAGIAAGIEDCQRGAGDAADSAEFRFPPGRASV
jgi:hypothetical protein